MEYCFTAFGHKNILATHKTTLEFTKDKNITSKGDCIVGINSDFDNENLKQFIKNIIEKNNKKIRIMIKAKKFSSDENFFEIINATINPYFDDDKEIVIRKSGIATKRTFAIRADKSSMDLSREFVDFLKNLKQKIEIAFIAE